MVNRWASSSFSGTGDVFETLHSGLTVNLISTPRDALMTCTRDEMISAVIKRNTEEFDFLPVVESNLRFVGLFHAAEAQQNESIYERISQCFLPLSEEYLIGADASILDFIVDADARQCRLVVSGASIVGLVSLSDLQRLPVRAALFALITGFEITMSNLIRRAFPKEDDWMKLLTQTRIEEIGEQKSQSRAGDSFVDTLLFTQFCDKKEIVKRVFPETRSKRALDRSLKEIQELRDNVAHANECATSPKHAKNVCRIVRELLDLRKELQAIIEPDRVSWQVP